MPEYKDEFTKAMARTVVRAALKKVADFKGNIDKFKFHNFQDYHKKIFVSTIRTEIRAIKLSPRRHLDIKVGIGDIKKWDHMEACMLWLLENFGVTITNAKWLTPNNLIGFVFPFLFAFAILFAPLNAIEIEDLKMEVKGGDLVEIWFNFDFSDSIDVMKSGLYFDSLGYRCFLKLQGNNAILAEVTPTCLKKSISFNFDNVTLNMINQISKGQTNAYLVPNNDIIVGLKGGGIDTIMASDFEKYSKQNLKLNDMQKKELKNALSGNVSTLENSFEFFREVNEEDSTKTEYIVQYNNIIPRFLGVDGLNLRSRGHISSQTASPLNFVEFSLFHPSKMQEKKIAKHDFIFNWFLESSLYGNQKLDTVTGDIKLGLKSLIPNLVNLSAGFNRLRLKPILELGVAGSFHSHELPVFEGKKDHMELFFSFHYFVPVAEKLAIIYDAEGNFASMVDENVRIFQSIVFAYDIPLKGLHTLVKWETGQNRISYETDNRILLGVLYNFMPEPGS